MYEDFSQCFLDSDEYKVYRAIEDHIGSCTPAQAREMYFFAIGALRDLIVLAVMEHIDRGYTALLLEFPELVSDSPGHPSPDELELLRRVIKITSDA